MVKTRFGLLFVDKGKVIRWEDGKVLGFACRWDDSNNPFEVVILGEGGRGNSFIEAIEQATRAGLRWPAFF